MRKVIDGNVMVQDLQLTQLFNLSDVHIQISFYCGFNNLTNLVGSPKSVGSNFICIKGNLISLVGATQDVGGNFNCRNNNLISLIGGPPSVGMDFDCSYNNLTNLIGAPETVGGGFLCIGNNLNSLEGIPKRIGYISEDKNKGFVSLYDKGFHISVGLMSKFPEEYIRSLSDIKGSIYYY